MQFKINLLLSYIFETLGNRFYIAFLITRYVARTLVY